MRKPEELRRPELIALVDCLQQSLYLDFDHQGRKFWNPNKQWVGADVCDQLALAMADLGLVPNSPIEIPDIHRQEHPLDDHDA